MNAQRITLDNGQCYVLQKSPFELMDALGKPRAMLIKYALDLLGDEEKRVELYKTDEGNCYDLPAFVTSDLIMIQSLKGAIDTFENSNSTHAIT